MKGPTKLGIIVGAAWMLGTGCVRYNDRCKVFVEDPEGTAGYIGGEDVYLDKPNARAANNAVGQMAADALLHTGYPDATPPVFAAYNGGGVRAEGLCYTHNILPAGSKVSDELLHEIFLFDDQALSVDVTGQELFDLMVASAKGLVETGPISDPDGNFLQIAGGEVAIDCAKPTGARITRFLIGADDLLLNANRAKTYRFATINFLLQKDGALTPALEGADVDVARKPTQASRASATDTIELYMKANYGSPAHGLALDRTYGPSRTEPRIQITNCAQPTRPRSI